jgi:sugar lactone lactonase YvrE
MSVADQQFLVDHASRIRMLILSKMTFSERHKLFEELRTNDPPEVVYKRCGESCLLATALTTEYLLWMTKRPYLLWSAIRHTAICRETHERFAEFEKSHSAFLSPSKRALYERWASTLMSGISRNLFNVVR